jgi:hypothetical protein
VLFGRRIQGYLAGVHVGNPAAVGPALRDVIEGRAVDPTGPIPGNAQTAQIAQQKTNIHNHARTHKHFGNVQALLAPGEIFTMAPQHPSMFVIAGVTVDMNNANRICDSIMDLLFSGRVSFEVGPMQALPPPAQVAQAGNETRSKRFLLVANLAGHRIRGLDTVPCLFNANPTVVLAPGVGQSSYVQLVISTQTQFGGINYLAPQSVTITLFPALNRAVGAGNALLPVRHPPLVRLWHFISDHKKETFVVALFAVAFVAFKMLAHGRGGEGDL